MALKDFYANHTLVYQATPQPGANHAGLTRQELSARLSTPISLSAKENPACAMASTQTLSVQLEHARQNLLAVLLDIPSAFELLSNALSQYHYEGVEFAYLGQAIEVVQYNQFVQAYQPCLTDFSQSSAEDNDDIGGYDLQTNQPNQIHFYSPFLIRISDCILEDSAKLRLIDQATTNQLIEYRRQLQTIRQKMIASHAGLVNFVACKYHSKNLSFSDLTQEGTIGLIKAVDRFDAQRGVNFSTYAVFWIKQAISRLILKQENVVSLPITLAEKSAGVLEIMRKTYLECSRWPSLAELEAQSNLTSDEIKTLSSYFQATHMLDAANSEDNDETDVLDSLEQHQFSSALNQLIDRDLHLYIDHAVTSLPEKQSSILIMRFGLKNHRVMTLQAIAEQLNVSRERVRQIQNQALKDIQQQFGQDLSLFLDANDF